MSNHTEHRITQADILPALVGVVTRELDESKERLANLQNGKNNPRALNEKILDDTIEVYTKKSEEIVGQKSLCAGWRDKPSVFEQHALIDKIESIMSEMETVYKQILFLAEYYKSQPIDKIIATH